MSQQHDKDNRREETDKQHDHTNERVNKEPVNKGKFRRIDTDHEEPSWKDVTKKGPHAYEGPIKENV